jgi:hypothetical protein
MKECRFEEQAHLYPFGILAGVEKERFETHMDGCEACRAIVREAGDIRRMAAAMEPAQPLAGLEDRILSRMPHRGPVAVSRWGFVSRWQRALIPVSAALCAVLLALVLLTSPNKMPAAQPAGAAAVSSDSPSGLLVQASLDKTQQMYLADDSDAALASYYDSLIATD